MTSDRLIQPAKNHLQRLCVEIPNRRLGSAGNRAATAYLAETLGSYGWDTTCPEFDCLDWEEQGASLSVGDSYFSVLVSPYSPGCQARAQLVIASSVEALEAAPAEAAILLLRGEIAKEQLMPKNFPFYQPEEHQRIIHLLEAKMPQAVIAATARNPELAGALYPFPLIEDGDFEIPSVYMTDEDGARLARYAGQEARLEIRSRRMPAKGCNVLAFKGHERARRIVLTAHVDAKPGTPGALDNAAGVTTLLLLAELLRDYRGRPGIEIFIVNGEDHYSAAGEIDYLKRNQGKLDELRLNINLDGVGYRQGSTAYSLYGVPDELAAQIRQCFATQPGLVEGEPWYQGDHMIFFQNQVAAMAITSGEMAPLWAEIAHTAQDRPELVDPRRLAALARALHELLLAL
jgi:aminopeptidase YwaD